MTSIGIAVVSLVAMLGASHPGVKSSAMLAAPTAMVEHKIYGTVQSLAGNTLVIRTRFGQMLSVDGRVAHASVRLTRNRPVIVRGTVDAAGVMHATSVWRTFPDAAHWPADR